MPCIELRFPGGYYHATPWGRHVNEGAVEWPPSPWRLMRALIATGFTKLRWREVPEEGVRLIESLGRALPSYSLPPATVGHTRHYMPDYKGGTDRVLDAFVYVGRCATLSVDWPVELDPSETTLLDVLLAKLTYVGRAESWVEARRVESASGSGRSCTPVVDDVANDVADDERSELFVLLAVIDTNLFKEDRQALLANEKQVLLETKREAARLKGKTAPSALPQRDETALRDRVPNSVVDSLLVRTAELRKAGWSRPPGTRRVSYRRPTDCLASPPQRAPQHLPAQTVECALLELVPQTVHAKALPPLRDTLRRADALHRAWVSQMPEAGTSVEVVSGKDQDGTPLRGHRHAYILAVGDHAAGKRKSRHIERFLIYAEAGLHTDSTQGLARVRAIYAKDLPPCWLSLVGAGERTDLSDIPQLRRSSIWVSETPYVPTRFLKRRGPSSLRGQIERELASWHRSEARLGAPRVLSRVEVSTANGWIDEVEFARWVARSGRVGLKLDAAFRHFRVRRDKHSGPPTQLKLRLRLSFDAPVDGPLVLGYAAHFGLGQFVPAGRATDRLTQRESASELTR